MSFKDIFDQADRLSGVFHFTTKGAALRQEDTSQIDNTAELQREQRGGKLGSDAQDQEIIELRKSMHKKFVPPADRYGTNVRRIVVKDEEERDDEMQHQGDKEEYDISTQQCAIPEIDWECEVRAIMIDDNESGDDEKGSNEKKSNAGPSVVGFASAQSTSGSHAKSLIRLRRSLPLQAAGLDKIDPLCIFEVDIVTRKEAESTRDELDVLIPNREDMYQYREEVEADGMRSHSGDTAAATSRQNVRLAVNKPVSAASSSSSSSTVSSNFTSTSVSLSGGASVTPALSRQAVNEEQELLSSMSLAERKAYNAEKKKERLASTSLTGLANSSFELNNGGLDNGTRVDDNSAKRGSRGAVTALNHSKISVNKINTWPDLGSTKLKYFHRPRLPKSVTKKKTWKVTFKNTTVIAQNLRNMRRVGDGSLGLSVLSSRVGDNPQELGLAGGEAVLLEYVEENPPLRLNYGMASRVVNYYRAPDTRNEDDVVEEEDDRRDRQGGGIRLMREKMYKDYHVPRHVKRLLEYRDNNKVYDHDANMPSLALGETKALNPDEKSPFLGEIEEGDILASVSNNLYRAPLFEQTKKKTDFLLVCVKAMYNAMHFIVRPLPRLMVVGQTEPLQVCMRPERDPKMPTSNRVSVVQQTFLRLAVARLFADESHHSTLSAGIEYPAIEKSVLGDYTLDRYWSPQRQKLRETLHGIVHELADESIDRQTGIRRYKPRAFYKEEYDEDMKMTGIEKEIHFSPEELSKRGELTPEAVCVEESSAAAEFRLRELGIIEALPLPAGVAVAAAHGPGPYCS